MILRSFLFIVWSLLLPFSAGKVLLYQQNLEKPFTGGLGSFKLYMLLAYHLLYNQSMFSTAERRDYNPLGLQLLTFLRYSSISLCSHHSVGRIAGIFICKINIRNIYML